MKEIRVFTDYVSWYQLRHGTSYQLQRLAAIVQHEKRETLQWVEAYFKTLLSCMDGLRKSSLQRQFHGQVLNLGSSKSPKMCEEYICG
jgi:hypothetical protein